MKRTKNAKKRQYTKRNPISNMTYFTEIFKVLKHQSELLISLQEENEAIKKNLIYLNTVTK